MRARCSSRREARWTESARSTAARSIRPSDAHAWLAHAAATPMRASRAARSRAGPARLAVACSRPSASLISPRRASSSLSADNLAPTASSYLHAKACTATLTSIAAAAAPAIAFPARHIPHGAHRTQQRHLPLFPMSRHAIAQSLLQCLHAHVYRPGRKP